MKKYKVEFLQTETFVVDVLAKDESEAKTIAEDRFVEIVESGTQHYHKTGNTEVSIGNVYDVTNTDDPFHASFGLCASGHTQDEDGRCECTNKDGK